MAQWSMGVALCLAACFAALTAHDSVPWSASTCSDACSTACFYCLPAWPQGVFLTFTTEGGAKKLRRIRFNRSLFSATSAKEVRGLGFVRE